MGLEIGPILAIGGPTGVVGAIIAILIKSYFDARKDNREQQTADVQTEGGYIDNAKKVVELIRGETERMEARIVGLTTRAEEAEKKNRELEAHINSQDDRVARQDRELEWLREDLKKARVEIEELRGMSP